MREHWFLLAILAMPLDGIAAGHGPVFGLATPTNSKGNSLRVGIFGGAVHGFSGVDARTRR